MDNRVLAIVLGGGQGTRLYPLTDKRSKPAVPIAGKYRLVDIPISNCIHSDILRIFVLTQFNSASLNKHLMNTYNFSHFSSAFVDILAAEQTPDNKTWFQGTADAVRQCMSHFLAHEFEYALILSGDQLYQMDYSKMSDFHIENKADITVATLPVNAKDAPSFGILKTEKDHSIGSFIEKPAHELLVDWASEVTPEMVAQERHYLASMGIYVFNKQLLIDILSNPDTTDFGKEIIPNAIGNKRVFGYQFEGYWTDIGTIESFYEANIGLTEEVPKFNLFDKSRSILTRARILPPTKMSGTTIIKSMVAEGGIIRASRIENSVVGIRARIGEDTVIKDSYIMGSTNYQTLDQIEKCRQENRPYLGIGDRCHINKAIVDKDCHMGNDVTINGGDHLEDQEHENYVVTDGIVVIKKGAVIPNGFTI